MESYKHLAYAWLAFLFASICWGAFKGDEPCRYILATLVVMAILSVTVLSIMVVMS